MKEGCNLVGRFRFSRFEVDLSSGELLKEGYRVKLQPQPFQVLITLLERPGEVVTREDLRSRVWPSDTYVDFDHSLNKAVNKIREALSDSSDHPRYVETMARRGYRFIAPVEVLGNGSRAVLDPASPPQTAPPRTQASAWIAAGCIVVVALAAVGWALRPAAKSEPVLTRLTSDAGLTTDPSISPDGKLIAYASDRGSGHLHIWVQQLSPGGQAVQLTRGDANDLQPAFSPDGARIVFRSEGEEDGVYAVPAIGGAPVQIAKEGRNPRFSPDGKWIVYWVGQGWLEMGCLYRGRAYLVPAAGGVASELRTSLANVGAPVWSPDSVRLLVLGQRETQVPSEDDIDWWIVPVGGGPAIATGAFATFRRQGLKLGMLDPVPFPREWTARGILFSAKSGDSVDLWRVAITPNAWRIERPAERLSSVPGHVDAGATLPDGSIAFASLAARTHLWSLRANLDRAIITGPPQQLTNSGASEVWPTISLDGRLLAYSTSSSGSHDVWVKDLSTGKETALAATAAEELFPHLSADGKTLAFHIAGGQQAGIYVWHNAAGQPQRVTSESDYVWGVSPNGRYLLCKWGVRRRVRLLDAETGEASEILNDPSSDLFQANFSPDGRWIAFGDKSSLWVAPFHGPGVIPKEAWVRITGGKFDDKPRWSPDGNSILFTSDRDGLSRCLWVQRLNPETKRPLGAPQALYHFHDPRRSIMAAGFAYSELALARDRLVFPLGEVTGNIWMVQPRQ